MIGLFNRIDPMVRLIVGAILVATVIPVVGEVRSLAQSLANIAIFTLFLLYGMRLSRADIWQGLGNHLLLVPLVIWIFGAMGIAGWLLWHATAPWLPAAMALGFLYLGVLPSTVQSATIYSSIAGGNVAGSVVAAALVNILAVFLTVPLYSLFAGSTASVFEGSTVVKVMTMLLLPFVLGQALQGFTSGWVSRHRPLISRTEKGVIALGVYVAFSGAVEQGIWRELDVLVWVVMISGCAALLVFGYGGSWLLGRVLQLPRGDRITMLFTGGQKSVAMGAPLALVVFPAATAGAIVLPLLFYHLSQLIIAAPIAGRLSRQAAA